MVEWEGLSESSRKAVRWAWAAAEPKTGHDHSGEPSAFDLLAGIVLAHRPDSEAQQLLDYFQIPLGAVLAGRRYDARRMLARYQETSREGPPTPSHEIDRIVEHAASALPNRDPEGLMPLRVLFGGLLETKNPAAQAIRGELVGRGVDAEEVVRSYREFLSEQRGSYTEFLKARHPFTPPHAEVPKILADQVLRRRPPDRPEDEPGDLVGIQAEVDAFAYLIASRALVPPLAVGLFGDWGSGKSFFMRSLQRRVDALANNSNERRLYRHIAQVEFNAWQYVGGDLWASLLEHLFRNLRTSADEPDSVVVARQNELIAQIEARRINRAALDEEISAKERERAAAAQEVEARRTERHESLEALDQQLQERPLAGWRPTAAVLAAVEEAAGRAGLTRTVESAEDLRASIGEARLALQRASPILQPLRNGGWPYRGAVLAVAVVPALLWLALTQLDVPEVGRAVTAATSFLALVAGYVKIGTAWVQRGLDQLAEAQRQLEARAAEERTRLDEAVATAERRLLVARERLAEAQTRQADLDAEAAALERQLSETTASRLLTEFIAERTGSEDYRKRLGVQAVVRQDLERLSELVAGTAAENAEDAEDAEDAEGGERASTAPQHPIDRIVLYIDDLDRCPTGLVIEVLQAVHLLLAFPLFVVVVAVDSHWLTGALTEHYRGLLIEGASPDDYLEKIFQVPFRVRPLDKSVRRGMARALLEPSVTLTAPANTAVQSKPPREDDEEPPDEEFFDLVESFGRADGSPQWLDAAPLVVTGKELEVVDEVAALLGDTPRSVKRFTNLFQLVKVIGRRRRLPWDDHATPPTSARVIFLLAMATGLPACAHALASAAERHPGGSLPLGKAIRDLSPPGHEPVTAWLKDRPGWQEIDLLDLLPWIAVTRRFSFDERQDA
ncbi:MAG: P-loop NTPase fold protein [Egibacteraceae bacterium]